MYSQPVSTLAQVLMGKCADLDLREWRYLDARKWFYLDTLLNIKLNELDPFYRQLNDLDHAMTGPPSLVQNRILIPDPSSLWMGQFQT